MGLIYNTFIDWIYDFLKERSTQVVVDGTFLSEFQFNAWIRHVFRLDCSLYSVMIYFSLHEIPFPTLRMIELCITLIHFQKGFRSNRGQLSLQDEKRSR